MKVIQILPELNAGGVERGTLEVGKYLVQKGNESVVISNGGRLVEQLKQEGSRHIKLPIHQKKLSSLRQVKVLRDLFLKEKPEIIHLRSRLPAWLAWLAWRKLDPQNRPRLVTTIHGFYSVNIYSAIMTKGEQVICVSDSVKDYVLKNYPKIDSDKLTVIHRGVDSAAFPYGYQPSKEWLQQWHCDYPELEEKYVVTLPGRITRWKGQLDFVAIIAELKKQGISVHGLLVGEPHPRKQSFFKEVLTSIESAGLKADITLVGHRSDLREIMSVSNVVVSLSSDPEAFGRVTLEALSLGKPVAGYDHGGVHEQLSALLPEGKVPVGNLSEMVNLLSEWSKNPVLPNAKNPFTLDRMLQKVLGVYLLKR
jgi:glycosyltransferase involved in cell wall biosynthesis